VRGERVLEGCAAGVSFGQGGQRRRVAFVTQRGTRGL
jgi:hypothetical protein